MKTKAYLLAVPLLALAGCDGGGQSQINQERQQRAIEEQRRVQAEQRAKVSEESKSKWQVVSMGAGCTAIVLLIVGSALGSRTKTDATTKRKR